MIIVARMCRSWCLCLLNTFELVLHKAIHTNSCRYSTSLLPMCASSASSGKNSISRRPPAVFTILNQNLPDPRECVTLITCCAIIHSKKAVQIKACYLVHHAAALCKVSCCDTSLEAALSEQLNQSDSIRIYAVDAAELLWSTEPFIALAK